MSRPSDHPLRAPRGDSGFALIAVVFLLFTVGVAATATYQIIRNELDLSTANWDADRARSAAEAGARLAIGLTVRGTVNTSAFSPTFVGNPFSTTGAVATIDDGSANPPEVQVTIRKVADDLDWEDLYLVTAIGRVTDPRYFEYPAIREVRVFARMRTPPINLYSPLIGTGSVTNAGTQNDAGNCVSGNAPDGSRQQNRSLAQIGLPDFATLLASLPDDAAGTVDYPVRKVTGNFSANNSQSGQGVLIVGGNLTIQNNFDWNGIILVGGTVQTQGNDNNVEIFGSIVAGLNGGAGSITLNGNGDYQWHSCHFLYAGQSLGALNPEPLTWWSGY